jgi:hypothetical protein
MTAPGSLVPKTGYPPAREGLVVVWGLLASTPFGGMTWQVLHHLAGFRRLGFDVWYVEDADFLLEPRNLDDARDVAANVGFLAQQMAAIGLEDRWLLRVQYLDDRWYGNGEAATVRRLHADADAVFNLCGSRAALGRRDDLPPNLVYLETDPGDLQVGVVMGNAEVIGHLGMHRRLYTYGVNVGTPAYAIPTPDLAWQPTRPPVVVDWWAGVGPARPAAFTTISQWRRAAKPDFVWGGHRFEWRKDILFERVIDLPRRTKVPLELALRDVGDDELRLRRRGWAVHDASLLNSPEAYRRYIRASAGEFTVSKDQYTKLRSGWFSDRSACYLAAGRPVVTQSTGFEAHMPTGEGLFAFDDVDGAAAALDAIAGDYDGHAAAALEIAREHFAHDRVLPRLLTAGAACG